MTRIEELRRISENRLLGFSSTEELFTHIDALTAQVATLRAACEGTSKALDLYISQQLTTDGSLILTSISEMLKDKLRDSGGDTTPKDTP